MTQALASPAAPAPLARVPLARPGTTPAQAGRTDRASDPAAAAKAATVPNTPPAAPDPAGKPAETGFALALATQQTTATTTATTKTPAAQVQAATPGKTLPAARPDPADVATAAPARLASSGKIPAHPARDKPARANDRSAVATTPATAVAADAAVMPPLGIAVLPIPPLPVTPDQPGAADMPRLQPGANAAPINPDQPMAMMASPGAPGPTPDPSAATPGVTSATGRRGAALFTPAAATSIRSGNLLEKPAVKPGVPAGAATLQANAQAAAQASTPAHHPASDAEPGRPRDTGDRQTASAGAPITPATPIMTINAPTATAAADAPPAPAPGPTDFATLVDQIARARAERHDPSGTAPVGVTMHHADFGRVSLHFSPREQGLAVTLHSADPGFAPAAAAAASGADGGTARDDRRAPDQQPGTATPDMPAQGRAANDSGRAPDRGTGNGTQTGGHSARASRASTVTATAATEAGGIFA